MAQQRLCAGPAGQQRSGGSCQAAVPAHAVPLQAPADGLSGLPLQARRSKHLGYEL